MKTIRGKITIFFALCLIFVGLLTGLYYENTMSLRARLVTIENFDDLLNNILELRRYEKNFTYYHDTTSLDESVFYFFKIENLYNDLRKDITRVAGQEASRQFRKDLAQYKRFLENNITMKKTGTGDMHVAEIREKGKALVDFAQNLKKTKRRRIERALGRSLIIPFASLAGFIALIVLVFHLVNRGILRPLLLVRRATEQVAKDTFTPIQYQEEKKDEISRLIAAFNRMAQELESRQEQLLQSRKLASIGTFTSGIAHELNNPLNNISLTAETLQIICADKSSQEIDELLQDILTQADRASQVVRNLLEFSRTEKPFLRTLTIADVLNRTLNLIKNQIMITGVELKKTIPDNLPAIKGKRQDLEQVFLNILANGIQAMPDGGKLGIRVERGPDGYIRTDISDTGSGIKPSDMEHIFDPFFTTKEVGKGTGLGLSLVYAIVKNHGGYIEVKSELQKGTTFSVYLPMAIDEEQSIEGKHQSSNH
jgi:two-component system NtrC family sensor kinase